jgi:hypothetical protein
MYEMADSALIGRRGQQRDSGELDQALAYYRHEIADACRRKT